MPVATTKKAIDMTAQHIEHKPANAPQPDSLALMLKQSTQDLHNQAEAGPFQQRMMDGKLLREEFVAFLQQVWHVQSGIEPLFREAAAKEPRFAEMLHENHFRLSKIEQDLSDLDAAPIDERLASTEKFIGFVEQATRSDPLSLVGVLYVKEGATNGNKIVAKRIREGLGLPESVAMGYLDPHGPDQRKRWMAFKEALDTLDMTDDEKSRCMESARATFRLFTELSAELSAQSV